MLKLAERHDVVIIEDEIFADFEPGPPVARLAGFDGLERVIQVGSYSKTISAALRCGYLALRPDWVDPIVDLKLAISLSSGHFAAAFLHRMLTEAGYRRHLDALRARLADAMGRTLTRLKAAGLTPGSSRAAASSSGRACPTGSTRRDRAARARRRRRPSRPARFQRLAGRAAAFLRFNAAASLNPRGFEVLEQAMASRRRARRR